MTGRLTIAADRQYVGLGLHKIRPKPTDRLREILYEKI